MRVFGRTAGTGRLPADSLDRDSADAVLRNFGLDLSCRADKRVKIGLAAILGNVLAQLFVQEHYAECGNKYK